MSIIIIVLTIFYFQFTKNYRLYHLILNLHWYRFSNLVQDCHLQTFDLFINLDFLPSTLLHYFGLLLFILFSF